MDHFLILGLLTSSAATVGLFCLCWQLLRQNGRILLRLEELEKRLDQLEFGEPQRGGLPLGSPGPDFELPGLDAERKSLADFRGQSLLLLFFNPACGFCRDMVPILAALGTGQKSEGEQTLVTPAAMNEHPRLLIISTGDMEQNRKFFAEHQAGYPVLVQQEAEVSAAYRANVTPSAYLIDAKGKIASELALGAEKVLTLANGTAESPKPKAGTEQAPAGDDAASALTNGEETEEKERMNRFSTRSLARSKIKRDGLKAGTPAPDFQLSRLDDRAEVSLSALRGRRVLIIFSSPHCAPCNELAPRLEEFHRRQPEVELVMITNGEADENRARVKEHGVSFSVVLQQGWAISRRYAVFASPAAYLIDQNGFIAHDVAVGIEPVLQLLARIT